VVLVINDQLGHVAMCTATAHGKGRYGLGSASV
jgi:hypothetical protein